MKRVLIAIVAVIASAFVLYKVAYPTYTHRYRLTIAIEVDGKVYRDSSVIEVSWIGQPKFGDAPPFISSVRGQAPFIDLGSRGALAAALHSSNFGGKFVSANILAIRAFGIDGGPDAYRRISQENGRRDLTADNLPMFILFSDVANAETARAGHIGYLFDSTARLVEANVEITRDPIVIDLDRKLPWYQALAARQKAGQGGLSMPGQFGLSYNMLVGADS
jgi:hypothetical protein